MDKVFGNVESYAPLREDASRIIISYGMEALQDGVNATWFEVYIYKEKKPSITFSELKDAVLGDINARTDERILSGYQWTILHGDDAGRTVNVWLTKENQENFKAKHDAAIMYPQYVKFPIVYKVSENEDKTPIYETFQTIEELAQFYLGGVAYIDSCLQEGWAEKDSVDWTQYATYFPVTESTENE